MGRSGHAELVASHPAACTSVYHKEFDSTLGFPGEGPAKGIKLYGLNANGLKGRGRVRALLGALRAKGVAVAFIQEHNHTVKDAKELERAAEAAGFAACIAPMPDDMTRGGTAVLQGRAQISATPFFF